MDQTFASYHGGGDRTECHDSARDGLGRNQTFDRLHPSLVHDSYNLRHFVCSPPQVASPDNTHTRDLPVDDCKDHACDQRSLARAFLGVLHPLPLVFCMD